MKKDSWKIQKLGEVAEINPRKPSVLAELPISQLVTFVPMAAVDEESGTITKPEVRAYSEVKKGFTYFAEGDVIFAKITPCMQNGKAAIASGLKNGLGFGSTEFHVLRPIPGRTMAEWIWFFVRQPLFRKEAVQHFRGSAGQQRVPESFLSEHLIPVASIEVQQRVVAEIQEMMRRVDAIRSLREEAIREAAAVFAAVLAENYASIQGKVNAKTIGSVTLESRYGTNNKCNGDPGGTPILRIPNVANGATNTEDLKFCELTDRELEIISLKDGDLLVVRTNGSPELVGRCAVFRPMDRPFGFASYLIRFRLDRSKVDPQFVAFFLESTKGRDAIATIRKTSAGQFNVNSENLQAIEFPCPSLPVQQKMVELMLAQRQVVNQIRAGLAEKDKVVAALQQSILRKAFAGEL